MHSSETIIEGRNAVLEALRSGKSVDKVFVLAGSHDGPLAAIVKEAKKHRETRVDFVKKERLDELSETGKHQGVIAYSAAYDYSEVSDILAAAREKNEDPFIFILDGIEDPHNLGAVMRTAECAGAHGVVIPKRHSCGLTETVAKASAGAIEYMPCVKVTNIAQTIDMLKEEGFWVCACDMGGTDYYKQDLTGKLAVVIGGSPLKPFKYT